MYKFLFFALASVLLICASCGRAYHPGNTPYQIPSMHNEDPPELLTESLFKEKDAALSEQDIQRILSSSIELPNPMRIAVYRLPSQQYGRQNYWFSDEEKLQTRQEVYDTLVHHVSQLPTVRWVKPLPALLSPNSISLTKLREAAVRLQADALIIMASQSDLYYNYKVFKKDAAKSHATCEVLLLDIRTGIIPFSEVRTHDFFSKKTESDLNEAELKKRVMKSALLKSVAAAGEKMKVFLQESISK